MDDIKKEHKKDVTQCLLECLKSWLKKIDDVKSEGGPTIYALNKALLRMKKNMIANEVHKESRVQSLIMLSLISLYIIFLEHPACAILSQHEEEFKDILPQSAIFLYSEDLVDEILLPSALDENVQLLLNTIRKNVCLNHHNLEKFAHALTMMEKTKALGATILEQYSKPNIN